MRQANDCTEPSPDPASFQKRPWVDRATITEAVLNCETEIVEWGTFIACGHHDSDAVLCVSNGRQFDGPSDSILHDVGGEFRNDDGEFLARAAREPELAARQDHGLTRSHHVQSVHDFVGRHYELGLSTDIRVKGVAKRSVCNDIAHINPHVNDRLCDVGVDTGKRALRTQQAHGLGHT